MAWKDVKGYEGLYQVSDEGEIKSLPRAISNGRGVYIRKVQLLKPGLRGRHNMKYKFVVLSDGNGNEKHMSVHRIVAEAFVKNPQGFDVINHIDKDTMNNRADNLEWCTQQYNIEYGHNKAVIQLLEGKKVAEYKSISCASEKTKIGRTSINNVLKGWSQTAGGYEWKYKERSEDLSHLQENY